MTSVSAEAGARHDPAHYTPAAIPPEMTAFDTDVNGGLAVGAAGKVGLLELALAPSAGKTRVVSQYQRAPLHVYQPIYLDPGRPDMAFIYLQQSGDGLVQGDRYRLDIQGAGGAAVHITTQAPTKIFAARDNFVTQLVNLRAGAGSLVEYLPDPVVPCRGSRLFQRTRVIADPLSTVIVADTLLPGRVAYREAHAYDLYWAETEVCRPDGSLLFTDLLRLRPDGGGQPPAPLGGFDVIASMYVLAPEPEPAALAGALRAGLDDTAEVLVGVSELPNSCGVAVRLLGTRSATVQRAVREVWDLARKTLIGLPAPNLRKG
jgi:urease accessory protein